MKCAICKNKTTWNTSFGRSTYLVCGDCFAKMTKDKDLDDVLSKIIKIGRKIEKTLDK